MEVATSSSHGFLLEEEELDLSASGPLRAFAQEQLRDYFAESSRELADVFAGALEAQRQSQEREVANLRLEMRAEFQEELAAARAETAAEAADLRAETAALREDAREEARRMDARRKDAKEAGTVDPSALNGLWSQVEAQGEALKKVREETLLATQSATQEAVSAKEEAVAAIRLGEAAARDAKVALTLAEKVREDLEEVEKREHLSFESHTPLKKASSGDMNREGFAAKDRVAASDAAKAAKVQQASTVLLVSGADEESSVEDLRPLLCGASSIRREAGPNWQRSYYLAAYVSEASAQRDALTLPSSRFKVRVLPPELASATAVMVRSSGKLPVTPKDASYRREMEGRVHEQLRMALDGYDVRVGARTESYGFALIRAANHREALALLADFHGQPIDALYGTPEVYGKEHMGTGTLELELLAPKDAALLAKTVRRLRSEEASSSTVLVTGLRPPAEEVALKDQPPVKVIKEEPKKSPVKVIEDIAMDPPSGPSASQVQRKSLDNNTVQSTELPEESNDQQGQRDARQQEAQPKPLRQQSELVSDEERAGDVPQHEVQPLLQQEPKVISDEERAGEVPEPQLPAQQPLEEKKINSDKAADVQQSRETPRQEAQPPEQHPEEKEKDVQQNNTVPQEEEVAQSSEPPKTEGETPPGAQKAAEERPPERIVEAPPEAESSLKDATADEPGEGPGADQQPEEEEEGPCADEQPEEEEGRARKEASAEAESLLRGLEAMATKAGAPAKAEWVGPTSGGMATLAYSDPSAAEQATARLRVSSIVDAPNDIARIGIRETPIVAEDPTEVPRQAGPARRAALRRKLKTAIRAQAAIVRMSRSASLPKKGRNGHLPISRRIDLLEDHAVSLAQHVCGSAERMALIEQRSLSIDGDLKRQVLGLRDMTDTDFKRRLQALLEERSPPSIDCDLKRQVLGLREMTDTDFKRRLQAELFDQKKEAQPQTDADEPQKRPEEGTPVDERGAIEDRNIICQTLFRQFADLGLFEENASSQWTLSLALRRALALGSSTKADVVAPSAPPEGDDDDDMRREKEARRAAVERKLLFTAVLRRLVDVGLLTTSDDEDYAMAPRLDEDRERREDLSLRRMELLEGRLQTLDEGVPVLIDEQKRREREIWDYARRNAGRVGLAEDRLKRLAATLNDKVSRPEVRAFMRVAADAARAACAQERNNDNKGGKKTKEKEEDDDEARAAAAAGGSKLSTRTQEATKLSKDLERLRGEVARKLSRADVERLVRATVSDFGRASRTRHAGLMPGSARAVRRTSDTNHGLLTDAWSLAPEWAAAKATQTVLNAATGVKTSLADCALRRRRDHDDDAGDTILVSKETAAQWAAAAATAAVLGLPVTALQSSINAPDNRDDLPGFLDLPIPCPTARPTRQMFSPPPHHLVLATYPNGRTGALRPLTRGPLAGAPEDPASLSGPPPPHFVPTEATISRA